MRCGFCAVARGGIYTVFTPPGVNSAGFFATQA
jgi:hypothetical protein